MRRWLVLCLFGVLLVSAAQPALARAAVLAQTSAADVQVTPAPVTFRFGEWLIFEAQLTAPEPVAAVNLVFQEAGETNTYVAVVPVDGSGSLVYYHSIAERSLRAFSQVNYWFLVTLQSGRIIKTQTFDFFYADNRFEWQTLEQAPFRVHWYEGTAAFGQFVLDKALAGYEKFNAVLPITGVGWMDIYVYGSFSDYQVTRGFLGPLWAGGHANPVNQYTIVSLPPTPDQYAQVERKIPHEVAHLLLYQAVGADYIHLPIWLVEGVASNMELYANPDYPQILQNAYETGTLLPFEALCDGFPREAGVALLSYAQSTALVEYILQTYGPAGLREVVRAYAGGAGCALGTRVAPVDQSLGQLERSWRAAAFGERYLTVIFQALAPWIALVLVLFVGPILLLLSQRRPAEQADPLAWVSRQ